MIGGPGRAPHNLIRGILEGLCYALRGWVPAYTKSDLENTANLAYTKSDLENAPNLFVDAAHGPGRIGWVSRVLTGRGSDARCCPCWVTAQHSVELWGVLAGLERTKGPTNLFVDNTVGEGNHHPARVATHHEVPGTQIALVGGGGYCSCIMYPLS